MVLTPLVLLLALNPEETRALMQRVAENLEKASAARSQYVYMQSSHARLLRGKSKVAREEKRTYRVTPQPGSTEFHLTSFTGTYWKGKEPIPYNSPEFRVKDMDLDGELLEDFAADHIARPSSKDGIGFQQFALRKQDIADYHFHLLREERVDGRKAVTIRLEPRVKDWDHLWSGEATIDLEDEFPVRLASEMNRKLPWGVRAFLGTDLKQLGYSATFKRHARGVWFPQSFGTEFQLRLFWGYARTLTLSMETFGFQKTSTDSKIKFEEPEEPLELLFDRSPDLL